MTTRPRILKAEYRHTKNGPAKITSDNKRKAGEAVTALLAAAVIVILFMAGMSWKAEAEANAASLKTAQATITALRATDAKRKSEIDGLKQAAIDAEYELDAVNEDLDSTVAQLSQAKREATALRKRLSAPAAPKATTRSTASVKPSSVGSGVSRWRPLVAKYFGANTEAALRVMKGESGGNPNATNGSCKGLYQIHACHAAKFKEVTGKPYSTGVFDPAANIKFAAYMSNHGSNWASWSVKP